jgi:hypothetical protein
MVTPKTQRRNWCECRIRTGTLRPWESDAPRRPLVMILLKHVTGGYIAHHLRVHDLCDLLIRLTCSRTCGNAAAFNERVNAAGGSQLLESEVIVPRGRLAGPGAVFSDNAVSWSYRRERRLGPDSLPAFAGRTRPQKLRPPDEVFASHDRANVKCACLCCPASVGGGS